MLLYLVLLKFEVAEKLCIFEAINHMLLSNGNGSDFEDGDEEEVELLQLTGNYLDPDYNLNQDMSVFAFLTKTKKSI